MIKKLLRIYEKLPLYYRKCCCRDRVRAETVILRKNPKTNQNEVLLVERIRHSKNEWKFPGGGVEKGESSEIAAEREAVFFLTKTVFKTKNNKFYSV